MAEALTKRIDHLFDRWATTLTEVRKRPPEYTVLSWHDGSYRYANGKTAVSSDNRLHNQDVLCRVDPDKVAWASVEVPVEAVNHLDGIVDNKLSQLSPWDVKSVKYGYDLAGHADKVQGEVKQVVAVAMANGADFEFKEAVSTSKSKGPRSVTYEVVSSGGGHIILRSHGESKVVRNLSSVAQTKSFLIALFLVAILGWVAWYAVDYWENENSSGLLERQGSARQMLQRIRAQESNNPDFDNVLMQTKRSAPSKRALLESLARLLPLNTYAEAINVDARTIRVSGLTDDTAVVLRAVADSGVFEEVRFTSPILREDNGSRLRFEFEAKIGLGSTSVERLAEQLQQQVLN